MNPANPAGQQGVAIVNGRQMRLADATLTLTDDGAVRGDGAFETVGVWEGRPFRLDDHLERLAGSLAALGLPPVDTDAVTDEVSAAVTRWGPRDGALRLYVTAAGTRVVVVTGQPVRPSVQRLVPQPAPWIHPVGISPLAGAKTMSYAANMAAGRAAQRAGGDDALLVSLDGVVLEGPTFCVLWVRAGVVHTAAVELGIIDSISRRCLLDAARERGHEVVEGRFTLEDVAGAEEFMMCSSVRPLIRVTQVGELTFGEDAPVTGSLAADLEGLRRALGPAPVGEATDANDVAIRRAALGDEMAAWLRAVAGQVDSRLDRLNPSWRSSPQADAARACAFGLLLGHLARGYPHVRDDVARAAEAHPSLDSLPTGQRLRVLEEVTADPGRAAAWLGPLVGADVQQRISLLFA